MRCYDSGTKKEQMLINKMVKLQPVNILYSS